MIELYYAQMEAFRNEAEEAYFKARPKFDTEDHRVIFRAGFERASQQFWREPPSGERSGPSCGPVLLFKPMESSTEPLSHQEIFSAVSHHVSEIVRLTQAVPAQCAAASAQEQKL